MLTLTQPQAASLVHTHGGLQCCVRLAARGRKHIMRLLTESCIATQFKIICVQHGQKYRHLYVAQCVYSSAAAPVRLITRAPLQQS